MIDIDVGKLEAQGEWLIVERASFRTPSGLVTVRNDPAPDSPKYCTVLSVGPECGVGEFTRGDVLLCGNAGMPLKQNDDGSSIWAIYPREVIAKVRAT